jgi:hypothetical protein
MTKEERAKDEYINRYYREDNTPFYEQMLQYIMNR